MTLHEDRNSRSASVAWAGRLAVGFLAAASVVLAFLFLASSACGGFRFDTPLGRLGCSKPHNLFWYALALFVLWSVVSARVVKRDAEGRPPVPPPGGTAISAIMLGLVLVFLWGRSLYWSYESFLLSHSEKIVTPLWESHVVYLLTAAGSFYLWDRLRHAAGLLAGFVGALLFAFSPAFGYVSARMAIAHAVLIVVWVTRTEIFLHAPRPIRARWLWPSALIAILGVSFLLYWYEHGLAGGRIIDRFSVRVLPGVAGVLALAGLVRCVRKPGKAGPLPAALVLPTAVGLALSAGRHEVGDVGALLMIPMACTLAGLGASALWRSRWVARCVLARNLFLLLLLGVLLGLAHEVSERHVWAPSHAMFGWERERTDD